MPTKATTLVGITLISFSAIQSCPTPIGALIVPLVSMVAPIVGEIVQAGVNVSQGKSSKLKRGNDTDAFVNPDAQIMLPPGISQHDVDLCKNANQNSTGVKVIQESDTSLRIENVEPECMVLASLFDGEGTPEPCASDCLKYVNVDPKHVKNFIAEAKKYL